MEQINQNCVVEERFQRDINTFIKRLIFNEIKEIIVAFLQFKTKSLLRISQSSFYANHSIPNQCVQKLSILNVSFRSNYYDPKQFLEFYLSNCFYNFITIQPNKYRFYVIMKTLALLQHDLMIPKDYLPVNTFPNYVCMIYLLFLNTFKKSLLG